MELSDKRDTTEEHEPRDRLRSRDGQTEETDEKKDLLNKSLDEKQNSKHTNRREESDEVPKVIIAQNPANKSGSCMIYLLVIAVLLALSLIGFVCNMMLDRIEALESRMSCIYSMT